MKYETFASRLGKGITKVRQEQNKTQAQVARDSGLSLKYVSMIEQGTNPSIRTILKMCDALETDITAVMDSEGIGTLGRKKSAKAQGVQVDIPVEDRYMKKIVRFIRGLDKEDRHRALRLIKTTFPEA
jgi:transcriptional regulator with XRE-family HTH domain